MNPMRMVLALCVVALLAAALGCGKAKEAATAVSNVNQAAKMAQGGTATFEGENGEKVEVKADQGAGKVTVKTDQGEMTSENKVDVKKLGIEVYPGADVVTGATVDHGEGSMVSAQTHTPDAFDKVAKFYKDKYPKGQSIEQNGADGKVFTTTLSAPPDMKIVVVSQDKEKGGTTISLQHLVDTSKAGK